MASGNEHHAVFKIINLFDNGQGTISIIFLCVIIKKLFQINLSWHKDKRQYILISRNDTSLLMYTAVYIKVQCIGNNPLTYSTRREIK